MNKKEIFSKIGAIVTELYEQHNYLSENPDNLNELELELFLANSKFLTGHIEIFQKLQREHAAGKPAAEERVPVTPPVENTTFQTAGDNNYKNEDVTNQSQHFFTDAVAAEPPLTEASHTVAEPTEPQAGIVQTDALPEPVVQEVIIEEKTVSIPVKEPETTAVPTVNDLISAQLNSQPTLAGQFTTQTVKDLKSVISLNDKLLFIKDLFNGYSLAYSEAVELLNRFDNFEAADNFLKSNYAGKNNWAGRQSTVDHFYEILNRRYAK